MGRLDLAFLGIFLVGLATLLQMVVDYLQSYAEGVPVPWFLQLLTIGIAAMTLVAIWLSLKSHRVRR